jgi:hypothetical protein
VWAHRGYPGHSGSCCVAEGIEANVVTSKPRKEEDVLSFGKTDLLGAQGYNKLLSHNPRQRASEQLALLAFQVQGKFCGAVWLRCVARR